MSNVLYKTLTMKDVSLAFFSVFLLASVSQSHAGQQSEKEGAKHEHSHESGLASHTKNTVHQYSPTIALLNSIYEGDLTPQQMVQQGNIGLGTVNQLAGELIAVDGIVYTIDAEGGIKKAPKDLKSPNMTMINFQPKQTLEISNITSYGDLNDALNKHRTSKNSFYAYKIKGDFKYLKMASAHKVKNEDVSLFEYLDTRVMYTRENIKGTLVGLFTPNYLGNIVIPGMHFHFLSNDIKLGGHLEDIKFDYLTVEVQEVNQVNLQLPNVEKFRTRELKDIKPPKATANKPVVEPTVMDRVTRNGSGYEEMRGAVVNYGYESFDDFDLAVYNNKLVWLGQNSYFEGIAMEWDPVISKVADGVFFMSWGGGSQGDNVVHNYNNMRANAHLDGGENPMINIHGPIYSINTPETRFPHTELTKLSELDSKLTAISIEKKLPPFSDDVFTKTNFPEDAVAREELVGKVIVYDTPFGATTIEMLETGARIAENGGVPRDVTLLATKVAPDAYFLSWKGAALDNHVVINTASKQVFDQISPTGERLEAIYTVTHFGPGVAPPKTTAKKVQVSDFALTKKWEISGFKKPESVFASADHPWLYVSNVNGAEPGFISRVAKDGTVDNYEWATGLNSPTGSDIYKNKLYVADTKKLHAIDLETGKIAEIFTADDAVSLNDVAIDQRTGEVFMSDVPGGKVYHLKEGKLSLWFESTEIPYPNGVLVQGNTLIVANYAVKNGKGLMRKEWGPDDFGTIYKVDIDTKAVLDIPSSVSKGGYDGVVEFNGVLMASSAPTGQVLTFEDNKSYLIDNTDKGVADINTDGKTIYAPYLFNNKLAAFEPIAWDRVTTKEEYLKKGADNYYGDAGGKSIATRDGKINGIFGGQQLTGTWVWEGEYFCRTSMLGKMDLGSDCIQIDVTEDKMRLVLNKGTGMSVVYDKKP